jgi:hypothetical protein
MTNKEIIAKHIADIDSNNYEKNLNHIYENQYRLILKVPIKMFFVGILNTFSPKLNMTIQEIKEVVQESLEQSGIEIEYFDNEWENLKVEKGESNSIYERWSVNTEKGYIWEFFNN